MSHSPGTATEGRPDGFGANYFGETIEILKLISPDQVDELVRQVRAVRDRGGRLFVMGCGGSAAHASHAVNDFRKLCDIESYCPSDNVAELTARTNDEGWDTTYSAWLATSRLSESDAILVLSVGGGDAGRGVSVNLVRAIEFAEGRGTPVLAVVGRDDGFAARRSDACVVVPVAKVAPQRLTPHTEGLTSVVLHLLVSDPLLQTGTPRWESLVAPDGG